MPSSFLNDTPSTPSQKSKLQMSKSDGFPSPGSFSLPSPGSVGSSSGSSRGNRSNDGSSSSSDFIRRTPGRSKSAPLRSIREKRVKLTSPIVSPCPFEIDVFGESPLTLDVWMEEETYCLSPVRPRRRRDRKQTSMQHHVAHIDLDD